MEKFRDRKFGLVLYPDNEAHSKAIDRLCSPEFRAVGCLHDQDTWDQSDEEKNPEHKAGTLKKAHWHFVVRFKNAIWNTALADRLGIDVRHLESIDSYEGAVLYLVHAKNPEKYQYDIESVKGVLAPDLRKLLSEESEDERIMKLLEMIERCGYLTITDLVRMAAKAGLYSDVRRAGYLMKSIVAEHNESLGVVRCDPDTGEVID